MKIFTKQILFLLIVASSILGAQTKNSDKQNYLQPTFLLTSDAALMLTKKATETARSLNATITVAIVDVSGNTVLILQGDGVGPHNTEAARRKAYTSLSTKTPTLQLMRNAEKSADAKNLNTLPELLLLSGGTPYTLKVKLLAPSVLRVVEVQKMMT